jgi:Calx-beta domain
VQFSSATVNVSEGAGSVTLTVTRAGSAAQAASVSYQTIDDPAEVRCDVVNGTAYARCDYATSVDTVNFAAGEAAKTITIPLIDDGHFETAETFQVALMNPSTGIALNTPALTTVTITDNDTATTPNPIFTTSFFVRQHYLDFLAREPEAGEPWSPLLNGCSDVNNNPACDRLTVSGAFFGSPEFLTKGVYTIVFYRAAFNRLPSYAEFAADLRSVTGASAGETNAKRATFAEQFVQRSEFAAQYGALAHTAYVAALLGRYQLTQVTTPDPAAPDGTQKVTLTQADLVNRLNAQTLTRAQVLRAIVQSDEVGQNREAINAFVAAQYYGYLRRAPEPGGFDGWVNYLTTHPGDFRTMVNGFMNSQEYRLRFGQP